MVLERIGKFKRVILLIAIILLILGIYFKFFYAGKCQSGDRNCFNVALARCDRVTFTSYGADSSWFYKIEGKSKENCVVYVENINLKTSFESSQLMGKGMFCYIPLGAVTSPEANIDLCHGELKEILQDLIIQKMHLYIVQNIGNISEAFTKTI